MTKIAPSILAADFSKLGQEVTELENTGADYIHIDVMDGSFVPNITFGHTVINSIRGYSDIPFDVHLMIANPEFHIHKFAQSGADIITIHAEGNVHLNRNLQLIKSFNKKAGVAINPATSLCYLEYIYEYLDQVLIMSVNPGFGGQKFIESSIEKIYELKNIITKKSLKIEIEVDGGINLENASNIIKAGADILVTGTTIFKAADKKEIINKLKNS